MTSVDLPILHHIFVPASDVQQRAYSSSLPYRSGDETFLVGTRAHPDSPRPSGGDEFERLAQAALSGRLRFEFALASLVGRFERVAEVEIGSRLSEELDALCFNPFNTGENIEPVGALNRWRRAAYSQSQRAWGSTGERALAQNRAEIELRAHAAERAAERETLETPEAGVTNGNRNR